MAAASCQPIGEHRVERATRLLRDERDLVTAHALQRLLVGVREVGAVPLDRARAHRQPGREQAEQRVRGHALAAAGLADQAHDAAGPHAQRDAGDERRAAVDADDEVLRRRARRPRPTRPQGSGRHPALRSSLRWRSPRWIRPGGELGDRDDAVRRRRAAGRVDVAGGDRRIGDHRKALLGLAARPPLQRACRRRMRTPRSPSRGSCSSSGGARRAAAAWPSRRRARRRASWRR